MRLRQHPDMIHSGNWSKKVYLSRVRLNTQKRTTQLALASPSKLHGAVEGCFVSREERKLWRTDVLRGVYYILIVSPQRPELSEIKRQFGYLQDEDEIRSYDSFLNSIEKDSLWQFRLAANPTHSVKRQGSDRGKVKAHVSEKYQMEWLNLKASQNGFSVLGEGSCVESSSWKVSHKKDGSAGVKIKEVVFQGVLRVDDADLFRKALTEGIGRGKAYGMGLLTVMRLKQE